jgi:Zn ribbon nucleic-acid-binding protein
MPRKKKSNTAWYRVRKKAPKVPDITCPAIDEIQNMIAWHADNRKLVTLTKCKAMQKKLEKLRTANEQLRDSGIYWHDACKKVLKRED